MTLNKNFLNKNIPKVLNEPSKSAESCLMQKIHLSCFLRQLKIKYYPVYSVVVLGLQPSLSVYPHP